MPSFLSTDNWLTRRVGAALFGWGTTITGPLATRVDENSTHDRWHFKDWPAGWVVKTVLGCGNTYGKLYLEVKQTWTYADNNVAYSTDALWYEPSSAAGPGAINNGIYDPYQYTGGDGHQYSSSTVYWNEFTGIPGTYNVYDCVATFPSGISSMTFITTGAAQTGGGTASNGNGTNPTNEALDYGSNWTGKLTPEDVRTTLGLFTTNTTYSFYPRKTGASSWAHSSSVASAQNNWQTGLFSFTDDYFGSGNSGITVLWDEDWTATGRIEKVVTKLRWRYDPQSSVGCKWWEDVQVEVKLTYKKAAMTKTDQDGVGFSLGSWVSAGTDVRTATLHDQYTDEYVTAEFTMPSEEGYVYVIDDVEVVSVTLP